MIQEILGGLVSDKNISIPYSSTCSSTQPFVTTHTSVSTTNKLNPQNSSKNGGNTATTTTTTNTNSEMSNDQNLRCPRCDSTNTKFCYYNNYNLTQPRHFCKACRRYWTKGGTLRNVPIGGGCRKNKSTFQSYSSTSNNNAMFKAKTNNLSCEMLVNENSLFLGNGFLDLPLHLPGPSPLLWSSLPQAQNSHVLSLLRGSNPNPSPSPSPSSRVFTSLGLDSYGNGNGAPPQLGSFTSDNQHHLNGFASEFVDNNNGSSSSSSSSNILDFYQRLKSPSSLSFNYGYSNNANSGSVTLGHMVGSTSTTSTMNSSIIDATPLGVGDHIGGYDFPLVPTNGSYP